MENLPVPARRVSESLLKAAADLDAASDERDAAHRALTSGAQALEYHLDTLSAQLRTGEDAIEPRLRPAANRLEGELQRLLADCWAAERRLAGGETPSALALGALAASIRKAASEELDMVFEALNLPGTMD
jgi:hypothetical protein